MTSEQPQTVGIIGTGIAGLSCTYLLKEASKQDDLNYHVTIFERLEKLGMDAHSMDINVDGEAEGSDPSKNIRLNTPPRAFSKGYYQNLMEMYERAGVAVEPWSWSFSTIVTGDEDPFFRVGDKTMYGFRVPSMSLWNLFSPSCLYMIMDATRFHGGVLRDINDPKICAMTVGEYIRHKKLSSQFVDYIFMPLLSMICTCSYEACLAYPIDIILHYFATNSSHGQFRTKYGTLDAVKRLSQRADKVHVSASVTRVWRGLEEGKKAKVEYQCKGETHTEEFDVLVLAMQANDVLRVVQDLTEKEKKVLGAFEHETSNVVVHTDEMVMPPKRKDWSPMSMMMPSTFTSTMFSIWANDAFPELSFDLFETWNPIQPLDSSKVLKSLWMERPLVTKESLKSVEQLKEMNGKGGVWLCGAWNAHRIPLQESAVLSALQVVTKITGRVPEGRWSMCNSHKDIIEEVQKKSNEAIQGDLDAITLFSLPKTSTLVTISLGVALVGAAVAKFGTKDMSSGSSNFSSLFKWRAGVLGSV